MDSEQTNKGQIKRLIDHLRGAGDPDKLSFWKRLRANTNQAIRDNPGIPESDATLGAAWDDPATWNRREKERKNAKLPDERGDVADVLRTSYKELLATHETELMTGLNILREQLAVFEKMPDEIQQEHWRTNKGALQGKINEIQMILENRASASERLYVSGEENTSEKRSTTPEMERQTDEIVSALESKLVTLPTDPAVLTRLESDTPNSIIGLAEEVERLTTQYGNLTESSMKLRIAFGERMRKLDTKIRVIHAFLDVHRRKENMIPEKAPSPKEKPEYQTHIDALFSNVEDVRTKYGLMNQMELVDVAKENLEIFRANYDRLLQARSEIHDASVNKIPYRSSEISSLRNTVGRMQTAIQSVQESREPSESAGD